MDTSKEYIKMCEKAVEIHKYPADLKRGDVFAEMSLEPDGFEIYVFDGNDYVPDVYFIWLPRQDQLQDMLGWTKAITCKYTQSIYEFMETIRKGLDDDMENPFKSMEQLWLAFVMKEKYNKVWNGKDWKHGE